MAAKFRTGLKIIIILLLACCVICGTYVYAVTQVNSYYEPAENDIFASSMDVKNIISTDDGNLLVTGRFLQGDDVMNDTSIFVKSYKEDGSLNKISSIELPEGYSVKNEICHNGKLLMLIEDDNKKSDVAYLYVISSNGSLELKKDIKVALNANDSAGFFAFWQEDAPMYALLKNGVNFIAFDENGNEIFTYELSLDFELSGISYAAGNYYLCGALSEDLASYAIIDVVDKDGKSLYKITAMENEISTGTLAFEKNGAVYVLGKYFDSKAYTAVKYPRIDYEDAKGMVSGIAKNSLVSQDYIYGEVLLSSGFLNSPWSNYFILKIDSEGKIISTVAPFSVSEDFGISQLTLIENVGNNNIAFGVSKMAPTIFSENYSAQVYFIDEEISTGKSADISIPKNVAVYFASGSDGSLICYTGLTRDEGIKVLSVRTFENTNEFAKQQKKLVICEKTINYIRRIYDADLLFGIAVFMILYITARMSGKNKK